MREWLREKREERGLTMKDMAEKLGISESYYCLVESGGRQKKMDIMLVSGLSAALKMKVADIVKLEQQSMEV